MASSSSGRTSEMQHEFDVKRDNESHRLGACEVCGATEAKYTCPRCEVKTCCLACVNIHKKELDCDGERNKILFKQLQKFTNLDMLSDYRLLEDVTRSVQEIQVDPIKNSSRFLPRQFINLGKAARDRGMRLHFLPRNFKRAMENTSYVQYPLRIVHWRIEWHFPQADVHLVSDSVPETMRLVEALSPHLEPDKCQDEVVKSKLQFYYSAGTSGVRILLRVGEMERNRYHALDPDSTIRTNLIHKSIVEFPVITVVLKDHVYSYDLYDSDEEVDQWKGNWENFAPKEKSPDSKGVTQPKKKTKLSSGKKNFLVASDDSSEDEV